MLQGIRQLSPLRLQLADGFFIAGDFGFQLVDDGLMVFLLPTKLRFHELAFANQCILLFAAEVSSGTDVVAALASLDSCLLHFADFPPSLLLCLFQSLDSL